MLQIINLKDKLKFAIEYNLKGKFMNSERISYIKFKEIALPTIVILLAINIGAMFNAFFVSIFIGESALAAVELFEPIVLVITIFETLFGVGGKILTLNRKAAYDKQGSNYYFTVSILSTVIISSLFAVLFILGKNYVISALYPPADVLPYVEQYATLLFLSIPLASILGVVCEFVQIDGYEKLSAYLMIIANVVILILDYLFLAVMHTDISGAALATLIGYGVGLIGYLKYHFDSKRTLHYTYSKKLSKAVKTSAEIVKIGFPNASAYIFEIIIVYMFNTILVFYLGNLGLVAFNICSFEFLIINIIPLGLIHGLGTVVPAYYPQHDYKNVDYLIRKTIYISMLSVIIFIVLIWTVPNLFLTVYGLNTSPDAPAIIHYMQLFTVTYIPEVLAIFAVTYYQAIKKTRLSLILSVLWMLVGPILALVLLFPFIGVNSIWIAYGFANFLVIIFTLCYIKINERKNPGYAGILFFEKDLIPITENFNLYSKNDKKDIDNYLKDLNVCETCFSDVESLINYIFDKNTQTIVEILAIDYDEYINLNIKFLGEYEKLDNFKKEVSNPEVLQYSETLGINNLEYRINK